jgi:hypothetical protein
MRGLVTAGDGVSNSRVIGIWIQVGEKQLACRRKHITKWDNEDYSTGRIIWMAWISPPGLLVVDNPPHHHAKGKSAFSPGQMWVLYEDLSLLKFIIFIIIIRRIRIAKAFLKWKFETGLAKSKTLSHSHAPPSRVEKNACIISYISCESNARKESTLASGANCASFLLFLLFYVTRPDKIGRPMRPLAA